MKSILCFRINQRCEPRRRARHAALVSLMALMIAFSPGIFGQSMRETVANQARKEFTYLEALYKELHAAPELSFKEEKTGLRIGAELKKLGCEVTTKVGGHGVVGVFKNGSGPTILVRTDLDALPVTEQTGLPYASKVRTKDDEGNDVGVMHACGHDIHMTAFVGTARVLTQLKAGWRGTLVFIGQPAEEKGSGAAAMLKDGLFTRFPKPNFCLALHVNSEIPAGTIGYTEGYSYANVDSIDILVRGVGGHGAQPQATKDPIVLASQIVVALQTIVSREMHPADPAVVTVGSIHGGTKHNIIPAEVRLQLTVRSYSDEVRAKIHAAIRRIVLGQALAAGVPEDKVPVVNISENEYTPTLYNDPALTQRMVGVFQNWFNSANVIQRKPTMGGEDFGRYGRTEDKIPICMFGIGAVSPQVVKESLKAGKALPSLHSPFFAPDRQSTILTGVEAMSAAVLELAGKP